MPMGDRGTAPGPLPTSRKWLRGHIIRSREPLGDSQRVVQYSIDSIALRVVQTLSETECTARASPWPRARLLGHPEHTQGGAGGRARARDRARARAPRPDPARSRPRPRHEGGGAPGATAGRGGGGHPAGPGGRPGGGLGGRGVAVGRGRGGRGGGRSPGPAARPGRADPGPDRLRDPGGDHAQELPPRTQGAPPPPTPPRPGGASAQQAASPPRRRFRFPGPPRTCEASHPRSAPRADAGLPQAPAAGVGGGGEGHRGRVE